METSSQSTVEEIRFTVWEMLNRHQSIQVLRNHVDPVTFAKISTAETEITKHFTTIESEIMAELDSIPAELSDDAKHEFVKTCKHTDTLLRILNHQPYAQLIWETIKPVVN